MATLAAALIAAPALADHNEIEMRDNTFIPSTRAGIDIWPRGEPTS